MRSRPPCNPVYPIALIVLTALPVLAAPAEGLIARVLAPNRLFAQAEISLSRMDDETVVRSIIHTRFLGSVRDDILGKERKNWDRDGDAEAYCRTLCEAFTRYAVVRGQDKESALVVDFITSPATARVEFAFAPVERADDGWRIPGRVAWTNLSLSRRYIANNQRLILQEAFGKNAPDVVREWAKTGAPPVVPAEKVP